ncbi:MAG: putative protein-disulfide isomerase [Cyclobacteriaceae bacterium]|jgi:putative protein-disulfide isomerase
MNNENCETDSEICSPAATAEYAVEQKQTNEGKIIYVGDPMCSWCYGISKHLILLKNHFSNIEFNIVVGGLRPGGGDIWDEQFKIFIQHHWKEVNEKSGQLFGNKLFDKKSFNYDTEPSCRAVVASRPWTKHNELAFFEAVSSHFYLDNEDPSEISFYKPICDLFEIPFDDFIKTFESEETKYITAQEFQLNRQWGVKGYPTVLFKYEKELFQINNGYTEFDQMRTTIHEILSKQSVNK